jgi:hypothetical protein
MPCLALARDFFLVALLAGMVAVRVQWVDLAFSHRGFKGLATLPPPLSGNSRADLAILDTTLQVQKTVDFLVPLHR